MTEDAGDLESSVHASVMPHSPIHWRHKPFQSHHMGESQRGNSPLTPPPTPTPPPSFSWGPPYTHIYLLAFLPTSWSYSSRFNHIGMSATICPVLVKHWCMVPGSWPLTPCTLRSWMPCTLPTKVSPVWKLTPRPACIDMACPQVSQAHYTE